jgi:endonuclease G, mitochondrial
MTMPSKEAATQFAKLLKSSARQRSQTRARVAHGQWRDAEPDPTRAAAYAAKAHTAARNFAEVAIGPTIDYQSASFLAEGADVRRAIGMVEMNLPTTSRTGTGFLIGNGLFITNQHVINNAKEALACTVTFDRELDPSLMPLATSTYRLDPERLFVSSPENQLDFAVVALGARIAGATSPEALGFCPLSPEANKHVLGMNVNIIQHPHGNYKQVAIRNNLLTYRTQHALLYETDTELGASGSPVFNDYWDVIALHHYGQPYLTKLDTTDAQDIPIFANEGVRISAVHAALTTALKKLKPAQKKLLATALDLYKTTGAAGASNNAPRPRGRLAPRIIGSAGSASSATSATKPASAQLRLANAAEAFTIDTNYGKRSGYRADFLPTSKVPLPVLSGTLAKQVAPLMAGQPAAAGGLLKYEHFSLQLHKTRRVAIYTATNIDGDTYKQVDRDTGQVAASEADTWFKDPRVSERYFLGQDFYSTTSNYFDRGHLTRRSDPTWGTAKQAARANADTFHFSNCSPQHFRFNQSSQYWQGLERYILENGVLKAGPLSRLCVFQGPVYNDAVDWWIDDDIQIPSSFWKVVVWRGAKGLKAVGMVADQLPLLGEERGKGIARPVEGQQIDVSQWRVHVQDIGKRTGLTFDAAVVAADTIGQPQPQPGAEAARGMRVRSLRDIKL